MSRELEHSHQEIKHLNIQLSAKKEEILSYQDKITGIQTELAQLRDEQMATVKSQYRGAQVGVVNRFWVWLVDI